MLRSSMGGHTLGIIGAVTLHAGIAIWVMRPDPPVVIPQSQIINISMVAPTILPSLEKPKPVIKKKEIVVPDIPAKEVGMLKIDEAKKAIEEKEEEKKKEEIEKVKKQNRLLQLTSGLQSKQATLENTAVTKPHAANYLKNPPPIYPSIARRRKQEGEVMLDVIVSIEGSPKSINIEKSSGHKLLDQAALKAVQRWKFVPARRGSTIVEANVLIPIKFRFN